MAPVTLTEPYYLSTIMSILTRQTLDPPDVLCVLPNYNVRSFEPTSTYHAYSTRLPDMRLDFTQVAEASTRISCRCQ